MMHAASTSIAPWRAAGAERPLLAWRDAQLLALAASFGQALGAWGEAWGLRPAGAVSCSTWSAFEPDLAWRPLRVGGEPAGWLQLPPDADAELARALFDGRAAHGSIAGSLVADCERDATARLLRVVGARVEADCATGPTPADLLHWCGIVDVRLPAPLRRQLLLQPMAVATWLERQGDPVAAPSAGAECAPLASVLDAAAALPVQLDVRLDGCDIVLGALQRLQPGDVVRMQHRIDAPAAVHDAAGHPLFAGYLGRRGDRKAVELAAAGAPQVSSPSRKVQP